MPFEVVDPGDRYVVPAMDTEGETYSHKQRPGQAGLSVTAIRSMAPKEIPVLTNTDLHSASIFPRWAREAISGTTPRTRRVFPANISRWPQCGRP